MDKSTNKISHPEIFNTDVFGKSLDKIYMEFVYMEAKIELLKQDIIKMKDWLEFEKDLWNLNE